MIGSTLSHYQITAKLGAGGMGEVYRATDTKLGREVAIKVLPEGLATDRERLSRFEREAKLLATLNHPNIAQVYGFDEDAGTHFLVMELAEGESLGERIRRGPIPLEEAISIALLICEALEAAHERGIVHRDLKPANVHVSGETSMAPTVKVLDFGLAKAMAPATGSSVDLTNSPTLTQQTAAGVLMGTAAYMSPEQARGQETDARSDIWAFGCVLYEMLTGRRAFKGESVSEILASVLKEEPDLDVLPDAAGTTLMRVLKRCLAKDPAGRWRHIGDVSLDLAQAHESDEQRRGATSFSQSTKSRRLWAWALAASPVLLMAGWLLRDQVFRTESLPRGLERVTIEAPLPANGWALFASSVSISADGSRLAVAGRSGQGGGIFVRTLADDGFRRLEGTRQASSPVLSADGTSVLATFSDGKGGRPLQRIPFSGGAATAAEVRIATWASYKSVEVDDEERRYRRLIRGEPSGPWRDCGDHDGDCSALAKEAAAAVMDDGLIISCLDKFEQGYLVTSGAGQEQRLLLENACHPRLLGNRLFFVRQDELLGSSVGAHRAPGLGPRLHRGEGIPCYAQCSIALRCRGQRGAFLSRRAATSVAMAR